MDDKKKIIGYYEDDADYTTPKGNLNDTLDFYDENMPVSALGGLISSIEEEIRTEELTKTEKPVTIIGTTEHSEDTSYTYEDIMLYSPSRSRTRRRTTNSTKKDVASSKNKGGKTISQKNEKSGDKTKASAPFLGFFRSEKKPANKGSVTTVDFSQNKVPKTPKNKITEKYIDDGDYIKEKGSEHIVVDDIDTSTDVNNNELSSTSSDDTSNIDVLRRGALRIQAFASLFIILSLCALAFLILTLNNTSGQLLEANLLLEKYEAQGDYDKIKSENELLIKKVSELEAELEELKSIVSDDTQDAESGLNSENEPTGSLSTHTVKPNENLWNISLKYLGDGSRYPEILEASGYNRNTVIRPGMVLTIPN